METSMILRKLAELRNTVDCLKDEIEKVDKSIEELVLVLDQVNDVEEDTPDLPGITSLTNDELCELIRTDLKEYDKKHEKKYVIRLKKEIEFIGEKCCEGGKCTREAYDVLEYYKADMILNLFDEYYFSQDGCYRNEEYDSVFGRILGSWSYTYYCVTKKKTYLRFALFHLTKSANSGDIVAINNLYFASERVEDKLFWLETGAKTGDKMMVYKLNKYYETGTMI